MTGNDELSGRKVGEYILLEPLDEGGFGRVYRCKQPTLGREAVVKVMHRRLLSSDTQLQRFLREAQLASQLDHPYAAHVYAFGAEDDGLLWIAMEFVHGITLKRWLRDHGPMPLPQLVPFLEHVAEVVQTAHDRGIVHRDLKPSNVMVIERAGRLLPKLLDLGVAKLLDAGLLPEATPHLLERLRSLITEKVPEEVLKEFRAGGASTASGPSSSQGEGRSRLTPDNTPIGTPAYMAPEQWCSAVTVGPSADLYALAVVAFEALSGRRPFEGMSVTEVAELRCQGKVPALGGGFPPALDPMFQRALAERPEDRFCTALELAGALRVASGIGAIRSDLPRIDPDVRDAWLAEAPQPLAEVVAAQGSARNAHQAHVATHELARNLLRYLLAVALTTCALIREGQDDPALLELVRALDRRELSPEERIRLVRLLVRPLTRRRGAHPIPELVDLVTPGPDGADGLDPLLALYTATDHAVTEDAVRFQLMRLVRLMTQLLRKARFVLDYVLVVPGNHAAERWTGPRRQPRAPVSVSGGELVEGHPMLLDRTGRVCVDLWPLVQAVAPKEGAEPELFVFDGHGSRGARLIAAPGGLEHHDSLTWTWVAAHVIAEIETKARMRDRIRVAAQQWHDRARPNALLWRGEVLADLERWMRHTAGAASLGDLDASFVTTSCRVGRRTRWCWRLLAASAVATGVGVVVNHFVAKERRTQQIAEISGRQAELEQGRQSLLTGDLAEAQVHLLEAYRRGDQSQGTKFMVARALQPRLAELARFASSSGRMWSAVFSPDGKQLVTTDDKNAQVWDAQTYRLLFTLPHGDTVYQAVYSNDGTRIITAGGDGTVRIWDAANGKLARALRRDGTKPRYVLAVASQNGELVAAMDLGVAHVWQTGTGAPLAELRDDALLGSPSLGFSADGRWLAMCSGNDVRVFDTRTWAQSAAIPGHGIEGLSWDPSGPRLLTGSTEGDVSIWEIPSGARIHHLREIGEPVDAVTFSPDGQLVIAASRNGAEQVWDAKSGKLRSQGNYLHGTILSVEFDRTSTLVVAAGASGSVAVADAALGMPVTILEGPRNVVRVAHFDPSSRRVVGASWDGTARIWNATAPYRRWSSPPITGDCGLVTSLEPDRRFVAVGCIDHPTHIWDTDRDQLLAELPSVTQVDGDFASAFPAVSLAGDRAAIARGNTVEVYELPSGRLLRTINHAAVVNAVAFATTGHDLISGAVDGSLLVTRDQTAPLALPGSSGGIDAAGVLPDGRMVATDTQRRLRVFDRGGAVLADLEVSARVRTLRMSLDSRHLITVPSFMGKPSSPELWDLEHYRSIAQLESQGQGQVYSARFVARGQIVTACGDGAARLWDDATGKLRQTYRGGSHFLADATLSSDDAMIVAGGGDGLLRFWDAASGRPLWTMPAHKSFLVGIRMDGDDIVTRGFSGDISRWALPKPEQVIEACSDHERCAIVSK